MRTIAILCVLLLTNTLMAQDANTLLPANFTSGPAIEQGAFRAKYEEAQAEIQVKDRLIADLRAIVKELEAKLAKPESKLVMVSMPGCPACDEWWAGEAARYRSSGWAVEHASEAPKRGRLYPYWRVCIGDSCEEIPWVPFNQLDGKVQAILDRRTK